MKLVVLMFLSSFSLSAFSNNACLGVNLVDSYTREVQLYYQLKDSTDKFCQEEFRLCRRAIRTMYAGSYLQPRLICVLRKPQTKPQTNGRQLRLFEDEE
jgi:hypothetical protein